MNAALTDRPIAETKAPHPRRSRGRGPLRRVLIAGAAILGTYLAVLFFRSGLWRGMIAVMATYFSLAFIALPTCWAVRYRHVDLDDAPRITWAGNHHPGDPLNIAMVGTKEEIIFLFLSAGWEGADPITIKTSLRMARCSVFKRRYYNAPISNLYLREGKSRRKQDLSFQLCVDESPRRRHHVRFWQTEQTDPEDGRPLWLGSATYDRKAKLNPLDLTPTHGIDGDVDRERDKLLDDLRATGQVMDVEWKVDFHKVRTGSNGGADRWFTDGRLAIAVVAPENVQVE
jgi:hypothetical protein